MAYLLKLGGELVLVTKYCKKLGYSFNGVSSYRYKYNLSWEEALNRYEANRNKRKTKDKRLRSRWYHMKDRCYNKKKHPLYHRYGGRGVQVFDRWQNYFNFEDDMYDSFIEHVKQFGIKDTTLERINFDGNYEPSNCIWKTRKEQQNNRITNRFINGVSLKQVCEERGLNYPRTQARIKKLELYTI